MSVELKLPVTLGLIAAAFAVPIGVQAAAGTENAPLPVARAVPTPTPTPTPSPSPGPGRVNVALAPALRKGAALPALRDPRRPPKRRARRHYVAPSPEPIFTPTPVPIAAPPPPPPTFVPTRQPTARQRPAATPQPSRSGTFDTTGEP
jgi:chitinase